MSEVNVDEKKKNLKFKISNLFKRYIAISNKKNLRNNTDFTNWVNGERQFVL